MISNSILWSSRFQYNIESWANYEHEKYDSWAEKILSPWQLLITSMKSLELRLLRFLHFSQGYESHCSNTFYSMIRTNTRNRRIINYPQLPPLETRVPLTWSRSWIPQMIMWPLILVMMLLISPPPSLSLQYLTSIRFLNTPCITWAGGMNSTAHSA